MEVFAAVVLGIVQGLTEFLPVSSSAHLVLVPWFLGWKPEGLTFDVALHLGTSAALLAFFWREWVELAREGFLGILRRDPLGNAPRRLAWPLALATIPGGVFGLTLEKWIEAHARSPQVIAAMLVIFGLVLLYAERRGKQQRSIEDLSWSDGLWIGLSQALALVPGVSRSGITISTAMLRDARRTAAARFSFLLSTPVILGAGVLQARHLVRAALHPALAASTDLGAPEHLSWAVLLAGTASASVTGFLCIRFFLRYLERHSFVPFVLYRIALAALVLLFFSGA
ncbi:MAG: undecaprenyl-diphosphatase UppP [Acidobacteria bacterium]|nr:MAG: undecaprenyl-diphosphatase UppP [Acidobacteriota bacterium]